jgi:amphiphysin
MNSFAEGRYDVTNVPGSQIEADYDEKRTDAWSQIEDLNITKRIISTCTLNSGLFLIIFLTYDFSLAKLVQANRTTGGGNSLSASSTSIGRSPSVASAVSAGNRSMAPPSRAATTSSFVKKAPPPPPGQAAAPPPPYSASASANGVSAAATKRPPPPPPVKPKPKPEPVVEYVTALYDFDAQVRAHPISSWNTKWTS